MKRSLSYKEKPAYKAIYSIEAMFHKNAVMMSTNIVKQIDKYLNANSRSNK